MGINNITTYDEEVMAAITDIEQRHDVKVLYVCDAGSRAKGFPSPTSDKDVGFLFAHRLPWYLSVVERDGHMKLSGTLDGQGWDIKKALGLLRASNPTLLEWLASSIVYYEHGSIASRMRALVPECASAPALLHHYYKLARSHADSPFPWNAKSLLHTLRAVLAIRWIEQKSVMVPVSLEEMGEVVPLVLRMPLLHLMAERMVQADSNSLDEDKHRLVVEFVREEAQRHKDKGLANMSGIKCKLERVDELLQEILLHDLAHWD